MGKFKELNIALEEARELLKEHSGTHKILDCNCDQALLLKNDLQKAINFGVAAEEEIRGMQKIVSTMVGYMVSNGIKTPEEMKEFGVMVDYYMDPDEDAYFSKEDLH